MRAPGLYHMLPYSKADKKVISQVRIKVPLKTRSIQGGITNETIYSLIEEIKVLPGKIETRVIITLAKIQPRDIDINTADTGLFIALPGIGEKLAGRIIQFREKLGGFYKIEQLSEVYGLQDSVFRLIRPYLLLRDSGLRKIQINSAGFDTLNEHPYIQFAEARAIVQYRKQHGSFNNISDLLKINILSHEWIEKAGPYLAFDLYVVQNE